MTAAGRIITFGKVEYFCLFFIGIIVNIIMTGKVRRVRGRFLRIGGDSILLDQVDVGFAFIDEGRSFFHPLTGWLLFLL